MTGHLLSHCLRVDFGHVESSRRTIAPPAPAPAEAMRPLLVSDGPFTQVDLIRTSGLNDRGGLSNLVAALHDAGLVGSPDAGGQLVRIGCWTGRSFGRSIGCRRS